LLCSGTGSMLLRPVAVCRSPTLSAASPAAASPQPPHPPPPPRSRPQAHAPPPTHPHLGGARS
jgi:hypothetical protein